MNGDVVSQASAFGQTVETLAHAVKPPACGCLTLRHNAAIILLFGNRLDSSARALLRPVIESSLRCEWLLMLATGHELKRIAEHKDGTWKELTPMAQMLDLLQREEFRRDALQTDLKHIHSRTGARKRSLAISLLWESWASFRIRKKLRK